MRVQRGDAAKIAVSGKMCRLKSARTAELLAISGFGDELRCALIEKLLGDIAAECYRVIGGCVAGGEAAGTVGAEDDSIEKELAIFKACPGANGGEAAGAEMR